MTYKPLTMRPPRLERSHKAKEYEAKGAECDKLAGVAFTPGERQAWVELRDDWIALAKEAKELSLWVEAAHVPLAGSTPLRDDLGRLDAKAGSEPVSTDDTARGETLGDT
jgi:hypothetical protein